MTYDHVKAMAESNTARQLAKKFEKEYAKSPSGLFHAHAMASKAARMKSQCEQGPIIKAKVDEILKQNPSLNLHDAYRRAGVALGIL